VYAPKFLLLRISDFYNKPEASNVSDFKGKFYVLIMIIMLLFDFNKGLYTSLCPQPHNREALQIMQDEPENLTWNFRQVLEDDMQLKISMIIKLSNQIIVLIVQSGN